MTLIFKRTMTYKRKQLPKYCRHKATNRAFVRIGGKAYYLGKYNSEASRREYDRIIGEFLANGRKTNYQSEEVIIENLIGKSLNYIKTERNYSQEGRICELICTRGEKVKISE